MNKSERKSIITVALLCLAVLASAVVFLLSVVGEIGKTRDLSAAAEDVSADTLRGYRILRARALAEEVIGVKGELKLIPLSDGRLLFTCRNAYALIDKGGELPVEFSVSLGAGEKRIGAGEAEGVAREFIMKHYPKNIGLTASLTDVGEAAERGVYELVFGSTDGEVRVFVKYDSGRVVGAKLSPR